MTYEPLSIRSAESFVVMNCRASNTWYISSYWDSSSEMTRNQRSLNNYGFLHDFLSHDDSYDYEYVEYEKGEDDEEYEVGKYIFMLEFLQ